VSGETLGVVVAKIYDLIDKEIFNMKVFGKPTEKQIQLANEFGYDISLCTRREGEAIISNIMTELNLEAIEAEELAPGVEVINKWDPLQKIEVISSIQDDGLVFMRGGNGKRAWARSLKRFKTT
jgi:hypothetical protein